MSSRERVSTQQVSPPPASPLSPATGGPGAAGLPRVPRLVLPFAPGVAYAPLPASAVVTRAEVDEFVRCVRGDGEERAAAFAQAMVARGVPAESIYLDLLAPAARVLGELWTDDACDFVDVTVGLGRLQRVLRDVSPLFVGGGTRPNAGRVLLSCIPGEQHSLGLFMVSEFFVRDGWEVSLGAPISDCDAATLLRGAWYDAVGFSVACNSHLGYLAREIPRLRRHSRNPDVVVLVGGRVFGDQPGLVNRVHADAACADARTAPTLARRLAGERAARTAATAGRQGQP